MVALDSIQRRTLYHFEFQPGVRDDIYFSKEKNMVFVMLKLERT